MHGELSRLRCAALRQFSSERDVGSEIKCLSGENLDCKQWPSRRRGRRSKRERERERERCYTIAKCVYLEGNSGGSKMKGEGGTGPGRVRHLVLILMIGIYFESYVLATLFLNWEHF